MLFLKKKDLKFRIFYKNIETKIKILKFLLLRYKIDLKNDSNNKKLQIIKILLSKKIKNTKFFKSKIVKRCIITNHNKCVFSKFRVSRHIFREYALFGILPGIKKFYY